MFDFLFLELQHLQHPGGYDLPQELLRLILAHRANPNASAGLRAAGETPLRLAVEREAAVEVLLEARADASLGVEMVGIEVGLVLVLEEFRMLESEVWFSKRVFGREAALFFCP